MNFSQSNIIFNYAILWFVSFFIGYLFSRTSVFRTKRWMRNLSYFIIAIISLPLSFLILLANEAETLISSIGGQAAGASLFWFYIGSRILDKEVSRIRTNLNLTRVYGVLMIASGIATIFLSQSNYQTSYIYNGLGITQIVFGLFAGHLINNSMKKESLSGHKSLTSTIKNIFKSFRTSKVSNSDLSKLNELGKLKAKGIITESEFEKMKSDIIK